jgi:hypothetical protein
METPKPRLPGIGTTSPVRTLPARPSLPASPAPLPAVQAAPAKGGLPSDSVTPSLPQSRAPLASGVPALTSRPATAAPAPSLPKGAATAAPLPSLPARSLQAGPLPSPPPGGLPGAPGLPSLPSTLPSAAPLPGRAFEALPRPANAPGGPQATLGPSGEQNVFWRILRALEGLSPPSQSRGPEPLVRGPIDIRREGGAGGAPFGEGYSAASPSLNFGSRAGLRGAGGWGYGSGGRDFSNWVEPDRRRP